MTLKELLTDYQSRCQLIFPVHRLINESTDGFSSKEEKYIDFHMLITLLENKSPNSKLSNAQMNSINTEHFPFML